MEPKIENQQDKENESVIKGKSPDCALQSELPKNSTLSIDGKNVAKKASKESAIPKKILKEANTYDVGFAINSKNTVKKLEKPCCSKDINGQTVKAMDINALTSSEVTISSQANKTVKTTKEPSRSKPLQRKNIYIKKGAHNVPVKKKKMETTSRVGSRRETNAASIFKENCSNEKQIPSFRKGRFPYDRNNPRGTPRVRYEHGSSFSFSRKKTQSPRVTSSNETNQANNDKSDSNEKEVAKTIHTSISPLNKINMENNRFKNSKSEKRNSAEASNKANDIDYEKENLLYCENRKKIQFKNAMEAMRITELRRSRLCNFSNEEFKSDGKENDDTNANVTSDKRQNSPKGPQYVYAAHDFPKKRIQKHISTSPVKYTPQERAKQIRDRIMKQNRIRQHIKDQKNHYAHKYNGGTKYVNALPIYANGLAPLEPLKQQLKIQAARKKLEPLMDFEELNAMMSQAVPSSYDLSYYKRAPKPADWFPSNKIRKPVIYSKNSGCLYKQIEKVEAAIKKFRELESSRSKNKSESHQVLDKSTSEKESTDTSNTWDTESTDSSESSHKVNIVISVGNFRKGGTNNQNQRRGSSAIKRLQNKLKKSASENDLFCLKNEKVIQKRPMKLITTKAKLGKDTNRDNFGKGKLDKTGNQLKGTGKNVHRVLNVQTKARSQELFKNKSDVRKQESRDIKLAELRKRSRMAQNSDIGLDGIAKLFQSENLGLQNEKYGLAMFKESLKQLSDTKYEEQSKNGIQQTLALPALEPRDRSINEDKDANNIELTLSYMPLDLTLDAKINNEIALPESANLKNKSNEIESIQAHKHAESEKVALADDKKANSLAMESGSKIMKSEIKNKEENKVILGGNISKYVEKVESSGSHMLGSIKSKIKDWAKVTAEVKSKISNNGPVQLTTISSNVNNNKISSKIELSASEMPLDMRKISLKEIELPGLQIHERVSAFENKADSNKIKFESERSMEMTAKPDSSEKIECAKNKKTSLTGACSSERLDIKHCPIDPLHKLDTTEPSKNLDVKGQTPWDLLQKTTPTVKELADKFNKGAVAHEVNLPSPLKKLIRKDSVKIGCNDFTPQPNYKAKSENDNVEVTLQPTMGKSASVKTKIPAKNIKVAQENEQSVNPPNDTTKKQNACDGTDNLENSDQTEFSCSEYF